MKEFYLFALIFSLSALTSLPGYSQATSQLVHEGIVEAPVNDVWMAMTTKAGLESWMTSHAEIELKIGGVMKTQYDPKGTVDDASAIHNTILSYDPLSMLSFKVSKFPEQFPFPNAIKEMWTVMYFAAKGEKETFVRIVCSGFSTNDESAKMREFFQHGNAHTLQGLQKRFSEPKK